MKPQNTKGRADVKEKRPSPSSEFLAGLRAIRSEYTTTMDEDRSMAHIIIGVLSVSLSHNEAECCLQTIRDFYQKMADKRKKEEAAG